MFDFALQTQISDDIQSFAVFTTIHKKCIFLNSYINKHLSKAKSRIFFCFKFFCEKRNYYK